jgi:hypothetical protein
MDVLVPPKRKRPQSKGSVRRLSCVRDDPSVVTNISKRGSYGFRFSSDGDRGLRIEASLTLPGSVVCEPARVGFGVLLFSTQQMFVLRPSIAAESSLASATPHTLWQVRSDCTRQMFADLSYRFDAVHGDSNSIRCFAGSNAYHFSFCPTGRFAGQ